MVTWNNVRLAASIAFSLSAVAGCGVKIEKPALTDGGGITPTDPNDPQVLCVPTRSASPLPARTAVLTDQVIVTDQSFFTRDLFNLFRSHCGGCHVDAQLGGYGVKFTTFAQDVQQSAMDRIRTDDRDEVMPPPSAGGVPWSARGEGDPVVELATLLEAWMDAGSPADVFTIERSAPAKPTDENRYLLSVELGNGLTNIGDCVPNKELFGIEENDRKKLDEFFAQRTELPEKLEQTDLFTLRSDVLAQHGVIAYVPAYPLWSDDAEKIRHVRVPVGTSIVFDSESGEFEIPDNSRFYKTFLKKVVDKEGKESFRKIETRLIVARQDQENQDGSATVKALFGTYAWNESETEAVLVRDPLRDGTTFRDRLVTVITNEKRAQEITNEKPPNIQEALEKEGLTRSYAIPGSERCLHCHLGSPSKSFILGFTPLQVNTLPMGESGVITRYGPDELNQLQRLIDYGIVTKINVSDDIVKLEDSQGDRKPRTEHELIAQGYMYGNCAHCHNPRGLASVTVPQLASLLNFWPSESGGIFDFPLDRFSPRIKRGERQEVPIPYVTPSLLELPVKEVRARNNSIWKEKADPAGIGPFGQVIFEPVDAPWRSLIYRNVDTPFTYSDHYAIFPHMPMDIPGFDCQAPRLLANWMVSIPAKRKNNLDADSDTEPQPYREVKPGDPEYNDAVAEAEARLTKYQAGARYSYCPDTSDIVDTKLLTGDQLVPENDAYNVPSRVHWVVTDLTEIPGDWNPRRPDWDSVLKDHNLTGVDAQQKQVIEMLDTISIGEAMRSFALRHFPIGLWVEKEECDFIGQPTLSSFVGDDRLRWMDRDDIPALRDDGSNPIYTQTPGGAVFAMICANCHGPGGDAGGRQADTIMTMTGGETRVANLRDGLFGSGNIERVFGPEATSQKSAEDWAAEYTVWMALGGTERVIPSSVLRVVSNTSVLGLSRPSTFHSRVEDANMLSTARQLCEQVLPVRDVLFEMHTGAIKHTGVRGTAVIAHNGDAELWEHLCAIDNPVPVRALRLGNPWTNTTDFQVLHSRSRWSLYHRDGYPADMPVGNHRGKVVTGISADNRNPWCIVKPTAPDQIVVAEKFIQDHAIEGAPLPFCPEELFAQESGQEIHRFDEDDMDQWTLRGAINAGHAVYLYLNAIGRGLITQPPNYDRCESL